MDLDHVAIAQRDVTSTFATLVGELGARLLHGGQAVGFRALQVRLGAMTIELLEPNRVEENDFLERFLARSGEGPHHLTFKCDDIRAELARAEEAGFSPVGVNLANPLWMEAFLHPKQAMGTVVQLAESKPDPELEARLRADPETGFGRRWWPDPPERAARDISLEHVAVTLPSLERGLALYRDLLRGEVVGGEGTVELRWPGGGRVRLSEGPGGIAQLACRGLEATRRIGGARFEPV